MKKISFNVILTVALLLATLIILTACFGGKDVADGDQTQQSEETVENITLFENGEYKVGFIYPALGDPEVTVLRNELIQAFKSKTGVNPVFKKDDAVENDDNALEFVFGETSRPQSAAPDGVDEDHDSYYSVCFIGNKLIVNGSDSYQLEIAMRYFIDNYLSGDKVDTLAVPENLNDGNVLKDFTREYWDLPSIPAYPEGEGKNSIIANVYNCGTTIKDYSAGGKTEDSSLLQSVKKTNLDEFEDYMKKLESFGFEKEYGNTIDDNVYAGYYDGKQRVYLTYNGYLSKAKIVLDPSGISLEEFGYEYTPKAGEYSEYYMYGIPMVDGTDAGYPNSGMLFVIRCADNSIIVIDGGDANNQMSEGPLAGFNDFLHEITSTPKGEKIIISAWFMTHYHADHQLGFLNFLRAYGDSYELQRVIANLPTDDALTWNGVDWSTAKMRDWNAFLNANYPDCKEIKVHTGQKINVADLTLTVLYTHEDNLTGNNSGFNSSDSNDFSTVMMIDNGEMSMLILGDANTRTQSVIINAFSAKTLECDILQATHHMIYHLDTIYKRTKATYVYIPQSEIVAANDKPEYAINGTTYKEKRDMLYEMFGEENCYFGGNGTVGYATINGKLTKVFQEDFVRGI